MYISAFYNKICLTALTLRNGEKMKNISVLVSTGSIGTQTLDVVRNNRQDLNITALCAGTNVSLLEEQVREFKPKLVCVKDESCLSQIKTALADMDVKIRCGMDGLIEAATMPEADIVVTAVVGMMGILPTVEAIKSKKDIALANKETLVTAGHIIMPLAKEYGIKILPVDSEHSAIFQSLNGEKGNKISKILLTASGGPFRGRKADELKNIRVEDALKHPNWAMGRKITIDSSTMVNKGLEVMEARWLFDVPLDKVQVVVHPQSVIHSMVEYEDGGVMAQLGSPDMRLPIQYALFYPERKYLNSKRLDFYALKELTFEAPDMDTFRGLALAYEVGRKGGNAPTVYNAANEIAVSKFLDRKIGYLDIIDIIEHSLKNIAFKENPDIETILETEKNVYELVESRW